MTCHPQLKGDKDHLALTTCVSCHAPAQKKQLFSIGGTNEQCGSNCFKCHNQWPKDGNHAPLDKCGDCHKS